MSSRDNAHSAAVAELLLSSTPDGLIAVDKTGTIVFFNAAAGRIFGREPEEMVGGTLERLMAPGVFVGHQRYVEDYYSGKGRGSVGSIIETEAWHSSGRKVPIEITLSASRSEGDPLVMASIRDITKRRELTLKNQALLKQVARSQKMEAIGTLVAGIAHEFSNTLGAILGYASAMIGEMDRKQRHYADTAQIMALVQRGRHLAQSLLNFSRDGEYCPEVMSLNRTVRNVVAVLRRTLPRQILIKTRLGREVNVEADQAELEQCLMNICLNARDAMPDGGELVLETRRTAIDGTQAEELRLSPGAYCQLVIRDNGVGMDGPTLARAFDPFFSTKPRGEGSGLGLTLVLMMVEKLGGRLEVVSNPGEGTEVCLCLPASDAEPNPRPLSYSDVPKLRRRPGEMIMVVDDERHLRSMARRLLESLGYRVLLADSGEQAVKTYRDAAEPIDLILLDVLMGAMSGAETLARLREINPEVRVLISSGFAREEEISALLSEGAVGFIQKPYGIDEIEQAIRSALTVDRSS